MADPESLSIQFIDPRPMVEIHLPDKRVISAPRGTCVGNFLKILKDPALPPIVGAIVSPRRFPSLRSAT